ncbi:TetR/AcrR family transcriptional regulator [Spirillospora sp. NPDC050679]
MPRQVDRAQRRRDITAAAIRLLAERGACALTLRELARQMGGSITLITHFYPTRALLLEGITEQVIADYDADLAGLEADLPPAPRLRVLLEWLLPLSEDSRKEELARILLLGGDADLPVQRFFDAMEVKMRSLLREHLVDLLPEQQVEPTVEALRVLTNGVVLSAVEHPGDWPASRQLALLDQLLLALGLGQVAGITPGHPRLRARRGDC